MEKEEELPKKGNPTKICESNIIEGRRARKPRQRWVHIDEGNVLQKSSYDADAYDEAMHSDTEIPQSDDEEEKQQIQKEVVDTDDEEAVIADDMSVDDDWHPTDDDEDETDDDDEEETDPAAIMLFKFDEDGGLLYHMIADDGLVIESSVDHLSARETAEVAVLMIDPATTILVCIDNSDIKRMVEQVAVFHLDMEDEAYKKFGEPSKNLTESVALLEKRFLLPVGKESTKKINKLIEDQDLVHYFFFD
jgi:hypothetical protein